MKQTKIKFGVVLAPEHLAKNEQVLVVNGEKFLKDPFTKAICLYDTQGQAQRKANQFGRRHVDERNKVRPIEVEVNVCDNCTEEHKGYNLPSACIPAALLRTRVDNDEITPERAEEILCNLNTDAFWNDIYKIMDAMINGDYETTTH
jgi:hypothetical protein